MYLFVLRLLWIVEWLLIVYFVLSVLEFVLIVVLLCCRRVVHCDVTDE